VGGHENLKSKLKKKVLFVQKKAETHPPMSSCLELNLVAVTTRRLLASTAPTATSGVSTIATNFGGAVNIAARPNLCEKPHFPQQSQEQTKTCHSSRRAQAQRLASEPANTKPAQFTTRQTDVEVAFRVVFIKLSSFLAIPDVVLRGCWGETNGATLGDV